jgi:hypothetical protein
MKHCLDFSLLPGDSEFTARAIIIGLPQALHGCLEPLSQTLERAESLMMFTGQSIKQSEPWRAAAFLWASPAAAK